MSVLELQQVGAIAAKGRRRCYKREAVMLPSRENRCFQPIGGAASQRHGGAASQTHASVWKAGGTTETTAAVLQAERVAAVALQSRRRVVVAVLQIGHAAETRKC
jgi:hypothetical protein